MYEVGRRTWGIGRRAQDMGHRNRIDKGTTEKTANKETKEWTKFKKIQQTAR